MLTTRYLTLACALAALSTSACAAPTEEAESDEAEIGSRILGDWTTPDPTNRWLKDVDVSRLAIGEESRLPNEEAVFDSLVSRIETFQKKLVDQGVNETTIRAFHAKGHACVRGEFHVNVDEPRAKVGMFADNATYPLWLRLSNGVAYHQKDKTADVRGIALKVMNVPGRKLNPGQEDATTQDFIVMNTATSFTTDAVSLIDFVEVTVDARLRQQATADRLSAGVLAGLPSFVPREGIADRLGYLSALSGPAGYFLKRGNERLLGFVVKKLVPATFKQGSYLGHRFWSQGAIAMGLERGDPMTAKAQQAAKVVVDPGVVRSFPSLGAQRMADGKWCDSKPRLPDASDPNYFHTDLAARMSSDETCMIVKLQFQTHAPTQLIEDTTVEWKERESPLVTVGYIRVPKMNIDDPANGASRAFCEGLAYTPWHALPAHRPLGNFQRARLKVYNELAKRRGTMSDPETGASVEPTADQAP